MSCGGPLKGSCGNGSMVWWDMETVRPPSDCPLLEHLLALHQVTSAGLFSLRAPVKVHAHGTAPLVEGARECISRSGLLLQQSISSGSEYRSSWKAMVIDVLLWATDHAPPAADMILVSRVLDRSLADVIHQLHTRSYNIIVATGFPPRLLTPLRQYVPPLPLLRQVFPEWGTPPVTHGDEYEESRARKRQKSAEDDGMPSLGRAAGVTKIAESSSDNKVPGVSMKDYQLATAPVAVRNPVPSSSRSLFASILRADCNTLVQVFLAKGKVEFKVQELKEHFMMRFGYRLDNKAAGYTDIVKLLQEAMPGRVFTGVFVNSQIVIQCKALATLRCNPTLPSAKKTPTISPRTPQASETGITMGEVRAWLEELASSGRAASGIDLSLLCRDFENHRATKLDYKRLGHTSLTKLLLHVPDLVRLERRHESTILLFPIADHGSRERARTSPPPEAPGRCLLRPVSAPRLPACAPPCTTLLPNQTGNKVLQAPASTIPGAVIQAAQPDTRSFVAMSASIPEPVKVAIASTSSSRPPELAQPRSHDLFSSQLPNVSTSSHHTSVMELQAAEGCKKDVGQQDACDGAAHVLAAAAQPSCDPKSSANAIGEREVIKRTFQSMSRLLDEEMERVNREFDRIVQSL